VAYCLNVFPYKFLSILFNLRRSSVLIMRHISMVNGFGCVMRGLRCSSQRVRLHPLPPLP
jgi:hypothetical protein